MKQPKGFTIAGWVLAVLIALMMGFSATMKLLSPPEFVEQFQTQFGYGADLARPIAVAELLCVLLFLIPRTSVLGGVLLAGYLGGAIATHVRVHDNFTGPAAFGIAVWLSLFFREPRVRALLPWCRRVTAGV